MSTCTDNSRLGRVGCGATYRGNAGHSVAQVTWATHSDGMAHTTFASNEATELCWAGGALRDPSTVRNRRGELLLEQDDRGYWRKRRTRTGEGPNSPEPDKAGL